MAAAGGAPSAASASLTALDEEGVHAATDEVENGRTGWVSAAIQEARAGAPDEGATWRAPTCRPMRRNDPNA